MMNINKFTNGLDEDDCIVVSVGSQPREEEQQGQPSLFSSHRSASSAAMQPEPAAVTA